jgi:hypothetical protein
VPVVFNFSHTTRQMLLHKGYNILHNGPLRNFRDEDLECLVNARAIVKLMWSSHCTVKSAVS